MMESIRKQREDAVVRTKKQRDDAMRLTQCGGEKCMELDLVVLDCGFEKFNLFFSE